MRITVTVDIAPDEVQTAGELLAVLRQLTDHVSVRTSDGAGAHAAAPAPPLLPNGAANPHLAAPRVPSPAAAPSPTPAVSVAPTPSAAAAPAIPFPPGTTVQQQLHALITQSEYTENAEPLARQLEALLTNPAVGDLAQLMPEFVNIWSEIALNPGLPAAERTPVPFVLLLQHLSQRLRDGFRDGIMRSLLKHLTLPRPVDADRAEYYVHAEVFGALVSIEVVPVDGAIQTMCTLARNPQKLGAAVTMLGKTVEHAQHLIAAKVSAKTQELMRTTVMGITDPVFQYDVHYIVENMDWAAGGGAAPGAARQLVPVTSIPGLHDSMIFALAADPAHQQFVSGGKDTYLRVWTQDGQPIQKLGLGSHYISSMDFHPRLSMLLCSCINPQTKSLHLAGYTSSEPQGFAPRGMVRQDDMMALATVRALPETTGFLTGETVAVNKVASAVIRYWDVAGTGSFSELQPTQTFVGHSQIATALRGVAGEASLFVSGDKEGVMLLWDLRSPTSVGAFGPTDGRGKAHGLMVTSIETTGHLVISGSTDRTVALWDVRQLGHAPIGQAGADSMTVLKLALNASHGTVAVAAVNELRLLDIRNPAAPVLSEPVVAAWPDGQPHSTYHDCKWNEAAGLLLAAGKDRVVDVFSLA